MAKVKNTGGQPRGFFTEDGGHVTINPGEEKEFNMTEADFKHLQQVIENTDDPKPFELSGSHGGVKEKKERKEEGSEMPAQSSEPPTPAPATMPSQMQVNPMTEKERREQQARGAPTPAAKKPDEDEERRRGR